MKYKFKITNMHDTVIWEGDQTSFYRAWMTMFEYCKYPNSERIISKAIDTGLWIEKVQ